MDIRQFFFNNRSYTPIPLIIAVLVLAEPNWISFPIGIGVAILGELIRILSVAHAGSATRTTSGAGGDELIMTGPYAYHRNPLYLGNFFLTIGLCVAAWPWMPWMLLITFLLFVFQYAFIIHLEEEFLKGKFVQIYQLYSQNVPRVFPRLKKYRSGQNRIPSLRKALHSERSTLTSFFLVTILIFLRWRLWS